MHFHQHVLRRCGSFGGLSQSQGRYQVIAVCLLASTVSGCVPFGEGHGLPPYKYLSVASVQAISSDGLARADRIRADNSMAGGRRALGSYVLDEPGLSLEIRHAEWMGESSAVKFRVKNASGSAFTVDPMRCEFVPTQQRLRRHVGAQGRPAELLVAAHELDGGDRGGPRIVFVAHTWEGTPGWEDFASVDVMSELPRGQLEVGIPPDALRASGSIQIEPLGVVEIPDGTTAQLIMTFRANYVVTADFDIVIEKEGDPSELRIRVGLEDVRR